MIFKEEIQKEKLKTEREKLTDINNWRNFLKYASSMYNKNFDELITTYALNPDIDINLSDTVKSNIYYEDINEELSVKYSLNNDIFERTIYNVTTLKTSEYFEPNSVMYNLVSESVAYMIIHKYCPGEAEMVSDSLIGLKYVPIDEIGQAVNNIAKDIFEEIENITIKIAEKDVHHNDNSTKNLNTVDNNNSEKEILPFLKFKTELHQSKLESINEKIQFRNDKITKQRNKISKYSNKVNKLEHINNTLKSLDVANIPVIKQLIQKNTEKISFIKKTKIPTCENKIKFHKGKIEKLSKKADIITNKIQRIIALSDIIKNILPPDKLNTRKYINNFNKANIECLKDKKYLLENKLEKLNNLYSKYSSPYIISKKDRLIKRINYINDKITTLTNTLSHFKIEITNESINDLSDKIKSSFNYTDKIPDLSERILSVTEEMFHVPDNILNQSEKNSEIKTQNNTSDVSETIYSTNVEIIDVNKEDYSVLRNENNNPYVSETISSIDVEIIDNNKVSFDSENTGTKTNSTHSTVPKEQPNNNKSTSVSKNEHSKNTQKPSLLSRLSNKKAEIAKNTEHKNMNIINKSKDNTVRSR